MKFIRKTLTRLAMVAISITVLILLPTSLSAQSADELNGDWQEESSGNRVRIEMQGSGVTVGAVTSNPGQASGAFLYVPRGGGRYEYTFPGGQIASMELIGPDQIRARNPDGWTGIFRRYSKPAATANAAAAPAPSTVQVSAEEIETARLAIENRKGFMQWNLDERQGGLSGKKPSAERLAELDLRDQKYREEIARYEEVLAGRMSLMTAINNGKSWEDIQQEMMQQTSTPTSTDPASPKPPQPDSARYWLSGRVKAPGYVCSRDFCFQIPIRIRLFTSNELVGLVDAAYSSGDGGQFVFSQPLEAGLTWRAEITQQDPNGIYDCKVAGGSEAGTVGAYPEALHPNTARDVVEVNCTMTEKGRKFLEVTK